MGLGAKKKVYDLKSRFLVPALVVKTSLEFLAHWLIRGWEIEDYYPGLSKNITPNTPCWIFFSLNNVTQVPCNAVQERQYVPSCPSYQAHASLLDVWVGIPSSQSQQYLRQCFLTVLPQKTSTSAASTVKKWFPALLWKCIEYLCWRGVFSRCGGCARHQCAYNGHMLKTQEPRRTPN